MRNIIAAAALLLLVGAGCAKPAKIANFEECAAAGNPVMESAPRQCRANGLTFVEQVIVQPTPTGEPEGMELTPAAEYGAPVTIEDGGSIVYPDGLQVTLLNIEDSRCPEEVVCVWAGELSPVLSAMLLDSPDAPVEVRLGATTRKEVMALDRTFMLMSVTEDSATITVKK